MALDINVDFGGQSLGEVGNYLMDGMQIGMLQPRQEFNEKGEYLGTYVDVLDHGEKVVKKIQNNATLRRDEWKLLDEAIVDVARTKLIGIGDLRGAGLVYNLPNAFGVQQLEWHQQSDALTAQVDMDADVRAEGDRVQFKYNYTPIPIIHVDYTLSKRSLEASRKLGNPLDTSMAAVATRKIAEKLENMLFTNITYSFGTKDENNRNSIYSYINFPDRNLVTLSTYGNWDDSSTTHVNIINSVLAMKQASIDDNFFGPWVLYVPGNYDTALDEPYESTNSSNVTVRDMLERISGIQKVQVVHSLTDDNVLLVQMTSDVVRLIDGLPIQNVEWMVNGGFIGKFKVLTIQVPQIRSEYDGKCGVVHMS